MALLVYDHEVRHPDTLMLTVMLQNPRLRNKCPVNKNEVADPGFSRQLGANSIGGEKPTYYLTKISLTIA